MKKIIVALLVISALLCSCGSAESTEPSVAVICKGEDGAPVAGVKIQLCTDASCLMEETGSDGKAVFSMEPGEYEIHVYKVPEGYSKPAEDAVNTTAQDSEIQFILPSAS